MAAFVRAVSLAVALGLVLGGVGQLAPDLDPRLYWVPTLALAALVAVGVAVTEDGLRDTLRVMGWSAA